MKLKLFIAVLCTVGSTLSEGMELTKGSSIQKSPSSIQHIPQDVTISILGFADYSNLAQSRQVCKLWKTLIDEKLPLPQRYILKYLAEFVRKKNPERTIKRFEEIFLAPLSDTLARKTALDDIIAELQDDLSANKEEAYQALLSSQLVSICPSITLEIYTDPCKLRARKSPAFPYIPADLFKEDIEHLVDQNIELRITGRQDSPVPIFGLGNIPIKVLGRVTKIRLDEITLLKIPRQFQKLSGLVHFSLNNSQLSSIPGEMEQLTQLQQLSLNNNQLKSIPPEIGQLTNLRELSLNNNQLNSIPADIRHLTNLQKLSLNNNQLNRLPADIRQLTNLQKLFLDDNPLSSIIIGITQLTNLLELSLNNNQLNSISTKIEQLTNLRYLSLTNNQLSSIPAKISQLIKLHWLYLGNNQLSSLPPEIGQLTNLQVLYLYNNQLSNIPDEIKKALPKCNITL